MLGSVLRALGRDSPVTVAVLTRNAKASTSRQSAGTRLPSSSSTMSPGTRSVASISTTSPLRCTFTFCGSNWRSAATARSALYSCQKEKIPLMMMTPTIATPKLAMPWPGSKCSARNASTAPAQRMRAKKWVNSRAKLRSRCSRRNSSTWLGPNSSNRRAASACARPAREVFRLARAWSGVSLCMCTEEEGKVVGSRHLPRIVGCHRGCALTLVKCYRAQVQPGPEARIFAMVRMTGDDSFIGLSLQRLCISRIHEIHPRPHSTLAAVSYRHRTPFVRDARLRPACFNLLRRAAFLIEYLATAGRGCGSGSLARWERILHGRTRA